MKVLVTGACGFIGTNLCEKLLKEGHAVFGIDDFSGDYPKKTYIENKRTLDSFEKWFFVEQSVLDKGSLAQFSGKGINCVVHLAAKTGVRDSVLHPDEYIKVNILGAKNTLDFARDEKASIVMASTSSVYGKNKTPFSETMPTSTPLSPYASTKIGMEALAHSYHNLYSMPITVLRFFTVYGPRGRTDMAVYKFTSLIDSGKEITVFGDGSAKRDFTYIGDIVEGIVSAMKIRGGFNVFNLGSSKKVSVNEVISLMEKNLGKKALVKSVPVHLEDATETLADISKAKKVLGYSPKTEINEGIRLFIKWFMGNR